MTAPHPPVAGREVPDVRPRPDEEPPPILGRWPAVYAVVLGELLLVIALCGWLAGWGR